MSGGGVYYGWGWVRSHAFMCTQDYDSLLREHAAGKYAIDIAIGTAKDEEDEKMLYFSLGVLMTAKLIDGKRESK